MFPVRGKLVYVDRFHGRCEKDNDSLPKHLGGVLALADFNTVLPLAFRLHASDSESLADIKALLEIPYGPLTFEVQLRLDRTRGHS
jgi:hypothetical protein